MKTHITLMGLLIEKTEQRSGTVKEGGVNSSPASFPPPIATVLNCSDVFRHSCAVFGIPASQGGQRKFFTLIELLIVIAIITISLNSNF
ncbi:MAG: type II secretion system protein [Victivallales bacterium]